MAPVFASAKMRGRLTIFDQARHGSGQFVATTMIGGNAWAYADDFVRYEGKPPLPQVVAQHRHRAAPTEPLGLEGLHVAADLRRYLAI